MPVEWIECTPRVSQPGLDWHVTGLLHHVWTSELRGGDGVISLFLRRRLAHDKHLAAQDVQDRLSRCYSESA